MLASGFESFAEQDRGKALTAEDILRTIKRREASSYAEK